MWSIIVHGGVSSDKDEPIPSALYDAILLGAHALQRGSPSEDAVEIAIRYMESSCEFNAGSCGDARVELDASIMNVDMDYGAIIGTNVANPISLAREIMQGKYKPYYTLHGSGTTIQSGKSSTTGTVGCVARDKHNNLCAGTSTGGLSGKPPGRISDSGIIGAGTYCHACAISCSGIGEEIIKHNVAGSINILYYTGGHELENATHSILNEMTSDTCGVIVLSRTDRVIKYNTASFLTAELSHNSDMNHIFAPRDDGSLSIVSAKEWYEENYIP